MTTILLDGDTVVYKFACGVQKEFDWGDDVSSQYADPRQGRAFVDNFLLDLRKEFGTTDFRVALSDPDANWRKDVLPTYKANRADFVKPIIWAELREYLRYAYDVYQKPTLEGDDICGILATSSLVRDDKVIVGIDKDLRTIPGRHYNPDTKEHFHVDEQLAEYNHLYQTLVGDRVDNYKGCPYVGPTKAAKILGSLDVSWSVAEAWPRVVEAFESKGLTEADALQQARVARICHHTDYDFTNNAVIHWSPPA